MVRENLRSVQYDRPQIPDRWEIQGVIKCTADVEKYPELSLVLSGTDCIKQLNKHESVRSMTPENWKPGDDLNVTITPPISNFNLMSYQVDPLMMSSTKKMVLPIRGFYQMRYVSSNHSVNLLLQLKLETPFELEKATISMPFAYSIREISQSEVVGQLSVDPFDDTTLLWTLDAKSFSNSEIVCQKKVFFKNDTLVHPEHLDGQHVKLSYRVHSSSLSGLTVSHVTCTPATKMKTKIQHVIVSTNSLIWNSDGACHHVPLIQ
eukprot:CAMPEP_0117423410 /NCGR_PEP_ID=MMETSP0758-20121206/4036_1 /TAXON_ID=63605 /ORGANISM="Percolomonas cosmopolitus, Strain AE-1 (ATCC 50343)" /LENGTH=262 /DNA_ID=CAMNT_0005206575 /DNA_START=648 /DNA_END=1436 /DNA_ORIENTATION=+